MKRLHFSSFRQRLNAAFLAVSLVPMLLCSGLLLQIFRLRMTSNAQQTAQQQLSASCEALDTLHSGFLQTAASLQHNPLVAQALFDAEAEDTAVYSQLFDATESVRSFARFDLYDISGRWRYSTQTAPEIRSLPTNWGLLYEAACAGTGVLVCSAAEDPADTDEPLLHAAMAPDRPLRRASRISHHGMLETQLRTLLGGTAGAQNELLLLDARWRPVYCTRRHRPRASPTRCAGSFCPARRSPVCLPTFPIPCGSIPKPVCISSCSSRSRSAPEHSGFCTR